MQQHRLDTVEPNLAVSTLVTMEIQSGWPNSSYHEGGQIYQFDQPTTRVLARRFDQETCLQEDHQSVVRSLVVDQSLIHDSRTAGSELGSSAGDGSHLFAMALFNKPATACRHHSSVKLSDIKVQTTLMRCESFVGH